MLNVKVNERITFLKSNDHLQVSTSIRLSGSRLNNVKTHTHTRVSILGRDALIRCCPCCRLARECVAMAVRECVLIERVLSCKSWVAVLAARGWSCDEAVWEVLEWVGAGGPEWAD